MEAMPNPVAPVGYEDPQVCAACGGKCCERMGGNCHPTDFAEPLTVSLAEALRSGKYAVDWWEGYPRDGMGEFDRGYYVRAAHVGGRGVLDPSWGGRCSLLTPDGCSLPLAQRPMECRTMKPAAGDIECESALTRYGATLAWLPYREAILDAVGKALPPPT